MSKSHSEDRLVKDSPNLSRNSSKSAKSAKASDLTKKSKLSQGRIGSSKKSLVDDRGQKKMKTISESS